MTVSSLTPEGLPNHCPICRSEIQIECSVPWGDAPCPKCGGLLWFVIRPEDVQFYEFDSIEPIRERLEALFGDLEERFRAESKKSGLVTSRFKLDSLDVVEFVMLLEDHRINLPTIAADLPKMDTLGDLMDYVVRNTRDD